MTPVETGVAGTLIDVCLTVITCIARWTDTAITINQILEEEKEGEKHMHFFEVLHKRGASVVQGHCFGSADSLKKRPRLSKCVGGISMRAVKMIPGREPGVT